ncbi:MAG: Bis(5'-nucleosyl)-tetraphosphatase, symmetrical [Phycisphaerae bacterium]|nr:Bis(5'-nucleosyl)-tetraphosphatase, symmetrical [Phycisphaerae bacterium]
MTIAIPELALVVLVGPSGSGKSTFARRHFKPTEVLSSDNCRALVSDDENDLSATGDAFDILHYVAAKRLAAGRLTVIDATSVKPEDRKPLVQLARDYHCLPVAIVFDVGAGICAERNAQRQDRSNLRSELIRNQQSAMRRGLRFLRKEGFRHVYRLETPEEVDAAIIQREPLWNNLRHDHGPFDIIGDVHGCFDELVELLGRLGYAVAERHEAAQPRSHEESHEATQPRSLGEGDAPTGAAVASALRGHAPSARPDDAQTPPVASALRGHAPSARPDDAQTPPVASALRGHAGFHITPPPGRKAVFLGDLVDRGPGIPQVLRLVMSMVADGVALCVPGNHDVKLMRKLRGKDVQITHGLAESLAQLEAESPEFRQQAADFIDELVSHYVLDDGRLVVAHAGMKAEMQGRGSGKVREFALYGETTGETDEFGLPVRYNWAAEYRGQATVVYGHTPVPEPEWLNRTINIDTGCVFGGRLTALRYPELERVSVSARRVYAEPRKPFLGREFGTRRDGITYAPRTGACAVIRADDGRVAIMRTPMGDFLPGGGADPGETAEQTLRREVLEECGCDVRIGREIGQAAEYVDSRDAGPVRKQIAFFEAALGERIRQPSEPDHQLVWLDAVDAARGMAHESHAWAIREVTNPVSPVPTGACSNAGLPVQHAYDDVLDLADLLGKRIISTRLHRSVIISAERGAAALEVMSRFAANPKWLIYLPPTMSPCETSQEPDRLEHPRDAFAYYRDHGQPRVVCQEKHMGSRAVVIVCRQASVARRRFGVVEDGRGIVYTRTGRRFFDDPAHETELLNRVDAALIASGLWDDLQTDWICLDCELMPWSAKAKALLQEQYAAVGAASRAALADAALLLDRAHAGATPPTTEPVRGPCPDSAGPAGASSACPGLAGSAGEAPPGSDRPAPLSALRDRIRQRALLVDRYVLAYQQYCWSVASIADLKVAPFHILATEGRVYADRDHAWHMNTLAQLCAAGDGVLLATPFRVVDVTDARSEGAGVEWWTEVTARGGEGMVVKPYDFVARGPRGLIQPAIKCRGREYLRIIYGPEYTLPEHLERLRARALNRKRALALSEFALGIEALDRFVRREPLRRTHECVFGILALESEPVDPRL